MGELDCISLLLFQLPHDLNEIFVTSGSQSFKVCNILLYPLVFFTSLFHTMHGLDIIYKWSCCQLTFGRPIPASKAVVNAPITQTVRSPFSPSFPTILSHSAVICVQWSKYVSFVRLLPARVRITTRLYFRRTPPRNTTWLLTSVYRTLIKKTRSVETLRM